MPPAPPSILQDLDQKIQEVYARIQKEQKVLDASKILGRATNNPEVLRRNEAQTKDAERSISYFGDVLHNLQNRRQQLIRQGSRDDSSGGRQTPQSALPPGPRGWGNDRDRALPPPPSSNSPTEDSAPHDNMPPKKQYSNLDLIKADTPYTTAKVARMLRQLEFKLQVEKQYYAGSDQLAKAYEADGEKKSRQDAERRRADSDRRIQLLQTALKRYKKLYILEDEEDVEEEPVEGDRKDNIRKPLSGKLQVTVMSARELEHAPLRRSSKAINETTVVLKIENTPRAKSHPSRTDRWNEEFEISVDKATELEITIDDKQGSDQPVPIGLLWIRISDLVDALRRQKVGMEMAGAGGGGWVTAAGAMQDSSMPPSSVGGGAYYPGGADAPLNAAPLGASSMGPEGIEAWFAVEPAGAVLLRVNFVKENIRKRPLDLARQGAVRRKDEVHEMNGHKFVQRQFYGLILCAFCNEFVVGSAGYQCDDCKYSCHKKCYEKVVTKCISKSNTSDGDEEKINHRIPHRFETITNLGANWCCHCGSMLPIGRKNAKKCSECGITCHASCAHFVPDFCGMSMETANQLLANLRDIKSHQKHTKTATQTYAQGYPQQQQQSPQQPPPGYQSFPQQQQQSSPPKSYAPYASPPEKQPSLEMGMDRMSIGEQQQYGRPAGPPGQPPNAYDPRYGPPPQQGSQYPYTSPPPGAKPTRVPVPYGDQQPQPSYNAPPAGYEPAGPPPPRHQQPVPLGADQQHPTAPRPPVNRPPPPQMSLPPQQASPIQQQAPQIPSPPQAPPQQPARARKRKVGLDDFNFLAVLGKGNFGKVMLAEEKHTSALYAIKVLKKEFIIDNDEVESTRSEKRVFLAAARERHPFLLGLHSCFQTETRVYFVMEYVSGGDLMLHIQRKQFSLRQAKFYASEVLLALEYFHANGIIYRDLKLDNILLTLDGHVKVADYGLCKEEMWFGQTTSTFCGTPEFMAPEILLEQRYGRAVDWWAFGVLTYEMLLGQSPFRGDDEDEIFDAILEDEPLYPITMPKDAVSILQKLLTRDPARRLGAGKTDAEEIKRHPFFKDVSFDDIFNKRIPPPYFPTISNHLDVGNFDTEFTKEAPTLTPVHGQLTSRDQQQFAGFSWVAAWVDA